MRILEIIQKKRLCQIGYKYPDPEALNYLFENVPRDARILDMMAKMFVSVSSARIEFHMEAFSTMPGHLLARCLLLSSKRTNALKCKTCNAKGWLKHAETHSKHDLLELGQMDPCDFHEHGDDVSEQTQCKTEFQTWLVEHRKEIQNQINADANA